MADQHSTTSNVIPIYRDPLTQWAQSAVEPVTEDSKERARNAQRSERAAILEQAWNSGDEPMFDRLFLQFFRDDPAVLTLLTARTAARGIVRARSIQ